MFPWPSPTAHVNLRVTHAAYKGLVFAASVGRHYARRVEKGAPLALRVLPMPREHRLLSAPPQALVGRRLPLPRIHLLCAWRPRPPKHSKPAPKKDVFIYQHALAFGSQRVGSLIGFGLFTAGWMTAQVAWQQRNWADFSYHMSAIIKGWAYSFYALLHFRPKREGLYTAKSM